MKFCRYNRDRLGVVENERVHDVTDLFDLDARWPLPPGDLVIGQFADRRARIEETFRSRPSVALSSVRLEAPVANPSKIIGAPINYKAHIDEANGDAEINTGKTYTSIGASGLFLKANTSLAGVSDAVPRRFEDRRTDHEIELAVVIGREARDVERAHALDHVLGYSVGLDMTVRGSEFPCFRKSIDGYTVLGPYLVTADEIEDPNALDLSLSVNGERRQASNTEKLIFDVQRLIEYASSFYTLYPGDVIMTGTPEGVGPVLPGDVITGEIQSVGRLTVDVGRWTSSP